MNISLCQTLFVYYIIQYSGSFLDVERTKDTDNVDFYWACNGINLRILFLITIIFSHCASKNNMFRYIFNLFLIVIYRFVKYNDYY